MWITLTLIAAFIWAICNFVDKHITESKLPEMPRYYAFSALGSFFLAGGIACFTEFWLPAWPHTLLLLLSGGAFAGMIWFYLQALKIEEASYVVPLFQLVPVWVAVMGVFCLDETLMGRDLIAFLIIFSGGLILSVKEVSAKALSFRPALGYMAVATLFVSVMFIGFKYVQNLYPDNFWSLYALQLWGQVLVCGALALGGWKSEFTKKFNGDLKGTFPIFFANDFISFIAFACFLWALTLAPAALVSSLGSFSGFFVFIIGFCFTKLAPHIITEDISPVVVFQKLLGASVIVLGVFVLQGL